MGLPHFVRWRPGGVSAAFLVGLAFVGCGEDEAEPVPDGNRVSIQSLRYAGADAANGGGGEGGAAGPAAPPAPLFCFDPIVFEGGLPECFVAEVADVLDCTTYGREPLRAEWEEPLRSHLCDEEDLPFEADCEDLPVCGIVKLTGVDADACGVGDPSAPGYCALDAMAPECDITVGDSISVVTRTDAPLFDDAPKLVYAVCVVDPSLGG